jgi:predicted RNA-binding Zn-ribbon protein involved in translation (DUF1610 family)
MKPPQPAWRDAGLAAARDPHARIPCPRCGEAELHIEDHPGVAGVIERWLRCPACGAHEAIRLRRPDTA